MGTATTGEHDYTILTELRRHTALLTEVRDAMTQPIPYVPADQPEAPRFTVGQVLMLPEPPIGSKVCDREGDEWSRSQHGWEVWDSDDEVPWLTVTKYAPLTILEVGTGEVPC